MAAQDCINEIRKAFRGKTQLSDEDITTILEELQRRVDDRQGRFGGTTDEEWFKQASAMAKDVMEAAHIERRNRRLNVKAKQNLLDLAADADRRFGDSSLGVEAAMVGINSPMPGGRISVDARGESLFNGYFGEMVAGLERADLLVHLNSGHLDLEIARGLEKITKKSAKGTTNKTAKQIAEIIHKHRKIAFDRQNKAGAWQKSLEGRVTTQSHDMLRLRKAGMEEWKSVVRRFWDEGRTLRGEKDADRFLTAVYNSLAAGEHFRGLGADETDLRLAFTGPGNLARRISEAPRTIHFKDADAWHDYNKIFGMRSLRESVVNEFDRMARNTALMEVFGTNPKFMFDEVLEDLKNLHREKGEVKKIDRLKRNTLQHQFKVIDGTTRIPVNINMAWWGQVIRNTESMAKLGAAVISSLSDIGNAAAEIRHQNGGGIFSPVAKAVSAAVDGLPRKEKRVAGELIGVGLDGMLGDVAARFSGRDSVVSAGQQAMRLYFKLNLLGPWTDAVKRGTGLMLTRDLAMNERVGFADLSETMRVRLSQFGIEAQHWEVARKAVREGPDAKRYLFPDEIQNLSDEDFLRAGLDPAIDRDALETAVRAYIVDSVEAAVPTPGAREEAILTQGTQPGTAVGEAIRFIAQFKAFPVTVASKTLGRKIYGNPDGKSDKVGLAMFIASTTLLGYAAMAAKDLSRGKKPRDPLSKDTVIASFIQGGGAGIFGDFLFGETNRFGRSFLDTLAGPTIGTVSDLIEIKDKILAGEDVAATSLRVASQNTPYINLFYTRAAMDYLILYQLQELTNPGYLRRVERRLKKENAQEFLLPPSTVIPRGGGSRPFEAIQ